MTLDELAAFAGVAVAPAIRRRGRSVLFRVRSVLHDLFASLRHAEPMAKAALPLVAVVRPSLTQRPSAGCWRAPR